ncbi:peptidase M19 [bacterium]|nr:MAG: peptidase M19 [bacterium]
MNHENTISARGISRRTFLATTAGAGAIMLLGSACARMQSGAANAQEGAGAELDPRVAAIVASTIGIDTHNHIDVPLIAADVPGPTLDLAGELKKSGLSAICMTFAVDYQRLTELGQAYDRFKNGLDSMDKQLELNKMKRALNVDDLKAAHDKGQPTVVQSVEGGHFLEGKLERVAEAYGRGLRHLGLLHDNDASVPLGDVYTNPPRYGGLTAFGREVIEECDRLGILVDMAHANAETLAAALKVAKNPVLVSHTGLDTQLGGNEMMARMMRPRLISKEQAKLVADAGGVIGVWTHLADTPEEFAKNVRALVEVIGIDHVCIGTDTKMTPGGGRQGAPGGPQGAPQGVRGGGTGGQGPQNGGPGRGGPGGGRGGGGDRTNQAWGNSNAGFFYTVVDAMLKQGFTPEEIGKVGGGNFCRIFDNATATHA